MKISRPRNFALPVHSQSRPEQLNPSISRAIEIRNQLMKMRNSFSPSFASEHLLIIRTSPQEETSKAALSAVALAA